MEKSVVCTLGKGSAECLCLLALSYKELHFSDHRHQIILSVKTTESFSVPYYLFRITFYFIHQKRKREVHNHNKKKHFKAQESHPHQYKSCIFYGYIPTALETKSLSAKQVLTRNWGKMVIIRPRNCITIMKWESWENKELIHCKCKTTLSL